MLVSLVKSLNKEEIRHYKLISNGLRKADDRTDFKLIDSIKKGEGSLGEDTFREIFYANNSNAFYRIKNRVSKQLCKSLLYLHSSSNVHHEILEQIQLSKVFYNKEQYQLSHQFLKKAEKKALAIDNLDYLNLIYRDLIKLSYELLEINPEVLIAKQNDVYKKQSKINELNHVLAIVNQQLRRSQNVSFENKHINILLKETIERFAKDESLKDSFQFQFSIYQITSQFLLNQQNWVALQNFVKGKLDEFVEKGLFSKSNHDTKLQMITYLINSYYKSGRLHESLIYTELLYDEMLKYNKVHYHKYLFFYYQALVMNYLDANPKKAKRILEEIKDDRSFVSNPYYVQFILLNLALVSFELKDYYVTEKSMKELLSSEYFSGFDSSFQLQTKMMYAVALYSLEQFDKVSSVLKETKNTYSINQNQTNWIDALQLLSKRNDFEIGQELRRKCLSLLKFSDLEKKELDGFFGFFDWIMIEIGE